MGHRAGSWIIANMVKDLAQASDLPLQEVTWVPDPALEGAALEEPEEDNETYKLVLVFAASLLEKTFSRETLERISESKAEQERAKTELGALLDRLVQIPSEDQNAK